MRGIMQAKKLFYVFCCFLVLVVCFGLLSANTDSVDSESGHTTEGTPQGIDDSFMNQSKEEFLLALSGLRDDTSASRELISIGYALLNRSDITPEDYITLMMDSENTFVLRQLAIECYAKKLPDSRMDDRVITFLSDSGEAPSLRTIAIVMLQEHFDTQNEAQLAAVLSAAESEDEALSYNAIKAMQRVWPEQALEIAQDIYENFEEESPARINIACKVFAQHYAFQQEEHINEDEVDRFVEKSVEIYHAMGNAEIKSVIPEALDLLPERYTKDIVW